MRNKVIINILKNTQFANIFFPSNLTYWKNIYNNTISLQNKVKKEKEKVQTLVTFES
jgi:hypothetical protein